MSVFVEGRRWTSAALASVVVCLSGRAHADGAADKAASEALFQQGQALVAEKKFDEACTKFELSQELDAGIGTLLYLADCYEQAGRFASAWATFKEAAAAAKAAGQADRERLARSSANALEPKLSRLALLVDAANAVEGFTVKRDGKVVPRGLWSVPVPVDAGVRHIEAAAPGKLPWSTDFRVEGTASSEVKIPVLADDPAAKAAIPSAAPAPLPAGDAGGTHAPSPEQSSSSGSTQRTIGLVVGGVGVVGLGVGAIFGIRAKSKDSEAATHCGPDGFCDSQGVDLGDQAMSSAGLATALSIGGAVALGTGVVLFLTAPSGGSTTSGAGTLRVIAGAGRRGPELGLAGTF
jgi:serine/threonine-protein kinase